jgi:hypothetical protein
VAVGRIGKPSPCCDMVVDVTIAPDEASRLGKDRSWHAANTGVVEKPSSMISRRYES